MPYLMMTSSCETTLPHSRSLPIINQRTNTSCERGCAIFEQLDCSASRRMRVGRAMRLLVFIRHAVSLTSRSSNSVNVQSPTSVRWLGAEGK